MIHLIGWLSTEEATRLIHILGAVCQTLPDLSDAVDTLRASSHLTTALEEAASAKTNSEGHIVELKQKKNNKKHAPSWRMLIRLIADPEVRVGIIALLNIARVFGKQPTGKPAAK